MFKNFTIVTAPHVVDPKNPGAIDEIINLGDFWNEDFLRSHKKAIVEANFFISEEFQQAYSHLRQAKEIHDEWESYYLEGMNFTKANQKTQELIENIFRRKPQVRHMFASALTPEGAVDYFANITENIETRYIVKGRPGTGKSTMAKKIALEAISKGYSVDYYHCSFDPESVDMIVIPELSVALLDGTAPHIFEPSRPGDILVDMLECVDPEVISRNAEAVRDVEARYNSEMARALEKIRDAKKAHDHMETYYVQAMDFDAVDRTREKILNKILSMASEKRVCSFEKKRMAK